MVASILLFRALTGALADCAPHAGSRLRSLNCGAHRCGAAIPNLEADVAEIFCAVFGLVEALDAGAARPARRSRAA